MLNKKYTFMIAMLGLTVLPAIAQDAQKTAAGSSSANYIEYLVLIVALLLVAAIWLLSSVLMMLSKKVVEVTKQNKTLAIILTILAAGFVSPVVAQDAAANSDATATVANSTAYYGGLSSLSFWTLSTVLVLELVVIFVLIYFIRNLWRILNPVAVTAKADTKQYSAWLKKTWASLDKKFFTKAAAIEHEEDIMLDHDYDGIKELDNALPPWWKYGFYITILVAVFYFLKFEVWHTGMNPTEEYNTEMAEAKAETDAYLASMKENVDEKSVVMLDAAGIAIGKTLFTKTCVACHSPNGGGGVGPNLTDNYSIHGAGIQDIFKTIKYGYPDKGMQAWQSNFSPVEMQQLASYVKSLVNTNVAEGKAPQGDLIKEEAATPVADSTKVVNTPAK
jgi:cytochrome c oxidase cbb3-type subunit 3